MMPADRDSAAIAGTMRYDAADLRLLESQLGQSTSMPLWKAALASSGLGAVMGFGVVSLAQRVVEPKIEFFSGLGPWGALAGAIIAVSAGAAYLTRKATAPLPEKTQAVSVFADGITLTTDKAHSLMRWPLFTRRVAGDDFVALLTEDNTWVLLRPRYFSSPGDYAAAVALIEANIA